MDSIKKLPLGTFFIKIILTLLVASIIMILLGTSPIEVMQAIFDGAFGRPEKIVKTMLIFLPISLASLALIITFSGGLWNIGIEGQIVLGAIGATWIAKSFFGETLVSPIAQVIVGMSFGALWGLLCGYLKVKFSVHEIFGGLGLDFVAMGAIIYLILGPWSKSGIASTSGTDIFPKESWFPTVSNLNIPALPLIIVSIIILLLILFLSYSRFGLMLRATGINPSSTNKYKFNSNHYIYLAFILGGAIAGLAGVFQASVFYHKLVPSISGGYGFLAILVVLASNRRIIPTLLLTFFFSAMIAGGSQLQLRLNLHSSLISIVLSSMVFFWLIFNSSKVDDLLHRIIKRN
jgi:simple sugar transport system permease protein